jgi:hypothetical protein
VASRWRQRPSLAAAIRRSTSSSVRCSRERSAAFGRRRALSNVTVGRWRDQAQVCVCSHLQRLPSDHCFRLWARIFIEACKEFA